MTGDGNCALPSPVRSGGPGLWSPWCPDAVLAFRFRTWPHCTALAQLGGLNRNSVFPRGGPPLLPIFTFDNSSGPGVQVLRGCAQRNSQGPTHRGLRWENGTTLCLDSPDTGPWGSGGGPGAWAGPKWEKWVGDPGSWGSGFPLVWGYFATPPLPPAPRQFLVFFWKAVVEGQSSAFRLPGFRF